MVIDRAHRGFVEHRQAAVLESRLIRTAEAGNGQGFAVPQ